jgi:outer membrane protein assembly factor BamB
MSARSIVSCAAVLAALSLAAPCAAYELIVDNHDTRVTSSGAWTVATTNVYGPDKYMHTMGTGSDTVTWTADLPAGWYRVDFRVNSNTGYTTNAQYLVQHRDGVDTMTVNQRRGSAGWSLVGGSFYFDGQATVTLTDYFTVGSSVVADALRFQSVFSFVQMSDSHVGYSLGTSDLQLVVNELKAGANVEMAPYAFSAPPPSFAIHTGDSTEFGREYWNTLMGMINQLPFPVYMVPGNHDYTWNATREALKARHGGVCYSFDHEVAGTRYHFAALNSSIIQSPRAGFARQELDWMATDLAASGTTTPAFLFFHHPIDGASDPKPHDTHLLMETVRPYVVPVMFYGHGHSFAEDIYDGLRIVQGGSTYDAASGRRGYNIITVTHNRVHIAKKVYGEATAATGLLNNLTIPASTAYPAITVSSPGKDQVCGASVPVSATIVPGSATVTAAEFELDGDNTWRAMTAAGSGPYTANLSLAGAVHGRHWIRVRFTMSTGGPYYRMVPFWAWDALPYAWWITDLGASSQSAPALYNQRVYVGTNGGAMHCLDARTGTQVWRRDMPSDVVSSPAAGPWGVVFGCGDGKVYCLNPDTGVTSWTKTCSGPVYSSPTVDNPTVYIGSNGTGGASAYLYAIDLQTGGEKWKFQAGNTIETKPCVYLGDVYFGAWDSTFYAVNAATGALKWQYVRNANRYYSPADSWPAAAGGRVFVADREYYMNAINTATGIAAWTDTGVSSQLVSRDGASLFQRSTSGNLEKTGLDDSALWAAACSLDSAPAAPQLGYDNVVVCDQDGLVSVVNQSTGAVMYQFQVARGYQLHPVSMDSSNVIYASTNDGFVVCAANAAPPSAVGDWQLY